MGQKVNSKLYRVSLVKDWTSFFYSPSRYCKSLSLDNKIRLYIFNCYKKKGIPSNPIIVRKYPSLSSLYVSSVLSDQNLLMELPLNEMIEHLKDLTGYKVVKLDFTNLSRDNEIKEFYFQTADVLANYLSNLITSLTKFNIKKVLLALKEERSRIKGYKIEVNGRINGVEITQRKIFKEGSIPLQSISNPIEFAERIIHTKQGLISVKVWLNYELKAI